MDTNRALSPAGRDTAVRRLRTATVVSALAGAAAVVTFGAVAAISDPGHQATTASTGSTASAQGATTGSADDTSGTDASGATPAPTTDSFFQAPVQQPGLLAGGGQTTTGGS